MSFPTNNFTQILALQSVLQLSDQQETRLDNGGGSNPIYVGKNLTPNAATSDSTWALQKLTYDGSGNLERVQLPDDGQGYLYSWDNRASYFS